jgi:GNAT superfamily N-acetyltransferase
MDVRLATVADARAIAAVAIDTWRAAYAGLMPPELLDGLDLDERAAGFRAVLEPPPGARATWVAEAEGAIAGFASSGPCRDADAGPRAGELYALYVRHERWGTGVSAELLERALASLAEQALAPVSLWVLSDNARARRFYEREGFVLDAGHERVAKVTRGYALAHARYLLR